MKSGFAVLLVAVFASLGLVACGGSDESTTATEAGAAVEPSGGEKKIEKIEQETKEAELEAAVGQKETAQQAVKGQRAAAKRAAAAEPEEEAAPVAEEESSSEPPNVIGMRLPEGESTLSAAGFNTQAENTDTTFGILVRSHYTICTQSEPRGDVVTVLAQKYGC